MKPLAILKLGTTEPALAAVRGDFEDWIRAGLGLSAEEAPVVDVQRGGGLPEPDALAGVVLTGSSSMVSDHEPWSVACAQWLRGALARELPILGICYGHQLLAEAAGGEVGWNPNGREIGTARVRLTAAAARDPLLLGCPVSMPVQVTHEQSVLVLPRGARLLCANEHDPHQGFALGERAWGFQFHPEFDADVIRRYVDLRREALQADGLDADRILAEVEETPCANAILTRFAVLCRAADGKREPAARRS